MPKRKGLCLEEKRVRLLQIFHEKKDFFQLKELEKIAPKEKGIIAQSVKDVLQSLVDDGMVDTDKIGSSVYFWAYPSQAHNLKKKKLDEFENKLEHLQLKLNDARKALAEAKQNRKDNAERQNALAKIEKLNEIKNELESKLKTYKDCDPSFIQKLKADTMVGWNQFFH